ncbi:MAG TPA: PrsW family glutamic-type intramembrane protease [Actinomycetota bacterium]|nr:PrsW family glutamic-type intramembrane protease [Actinomycetota bacterium]
MTAVARKPRLWWRVLGIGLALWAVTVAALWLTKNTALVPSVIFVGSFLTPLTLSVWLIERERYSGVSPDRAPSSLTISRLVLAFVAAGVLGVACSAVLESLLPSGRVSVYYLGVAVIEESVKLAAVWWLARDFGSYSRRDGMVLGACVGFGFAAFETAGVSFDILIQTRQSDAQHLLALLATEFDRSLLTPVGHGLWTALVAGALFASARNSRLRLSWYLIGWWALAVLLHFLWDASGPLSKALAYAVTNHPVSWAGLDIDQLPAATVGQVRLADVLQTLVMVGSALPALWLARYEWRKGRARTAGEPAGVDGLR